MTKEQALDIVEQAIDKAFERGKELSIHSVSDCFLCVGKLFLRKTEIY